MQNVFQTLLYDYNTSKVRKIGWLIFGISLSVHFMFNLLLFEFFSPKLGTWEHREIAINLLKGHGFVFHLEDPPILWRPPLYIFLLAGIYLIFGFHYMPVVLIQSVLQALTVVIVFFIGNQMFGKRTGLFAALILTLYPLFLYNSARVMTESLFTFLLALIVWTLLVLLRTYSWQSFLLLGLLLGLGMLCKASMQFFPFFFSIVFLFSRGGLSMSKILKRFLLLFLPIGLLVLPWTLRNYFVSGGELILIDTSGGYTFWVGNHLPTNGFDDDSLPDDERLKIRKSLAEALGIEPDTKTLAKVFRIAWGSGRNSRILFRKGIENILTQPVDSAFLWVKKFFRFWFNFTGEDGRIIQDVIIILQLLILLPALMGLYFCIRNRLNILPIMLVIGYFILLHTLATANVRYSIPIIPYIILLAVYGMENLKCLKCLKCLK
jgi:4-amino-4-deoxy-L-arabinose transferase-like glycosyltransferase